MNEKSKISLKNFFINLGLPIKPFIFFIVIFLVLIILAPFIFTRSTFLDIFDFSSTGQIGDTISGTITPVIAFMVALLTFLAFWAQYQANKTQTEQFKKQDTNTKIDRFESKFFELVKLHRANVEEMNIKNIIFGRKCFIYMFDEFKFMYLVLENIYNELINKNQIDKLNPYQLTNLAYLIFFFGIGRESKELINAFLKHYNDILIDQYIQTLEKYQKKYNKDINLTIGVNSSKGEWFLILYYKPFDGHTSKLGHYMRHLFQTVKFVVNNDEIFDDKGYLKNNDKFDKGSYLKTLRAQLSNYEQLLIFYNAISVLGRPWYDEGYLTDYRMIKNLPINLANFGVKPKEFLGTLNKKNKVIFEWNEILNRIDKFNSLNK